MGKKGEAKTSTVKKGASLELKIPEGTIVRCIEDDGEIDIGDLTEDGQRLVVARGGRGGRGNKHFTTSAKQAPRIAQEGEPGEEKLLVLDLKLLADVGLVGRPNVGKSTLINAVSSARSKVADYPFTTLEPKLGVVELDYKAFVIADIPGLIEGAHSGHGLGHDFLRHIERTRILIHIIDGTTQDPISDLDEINRELFLFNPSLKDKPQIVAVNKIDIPSVRDRLSEIQKDIGEPVYNISAVSGEGLPELMRKAAEILTQSIPATTPVDTGEFKVFRPKPII